MHVSKCEAGGAEDAVMDHPPELHRHQRQAFSHSRHKLSFTEISLRSQQHDSAWNWVIQWRRKHWCAGQVSSAYRRASWGKQGERTVLSAASGYGLLKYW
jgi:hypothetical protein